jgi:hypothetical protein
LVPHLIQQLCIRLDETTLCAQGVISVQIALEAFIQEIFGEFPTIRETLKGRVHIAGVTQVAQSHSAIFS